MNAPANTPAALAVRDSAGLLDRVLYRDGLMLVIDKPAGISVHAGPRGGLNLEAGFGALRYGLPHSPALAHRLDRDTSGCLVLARRRSALRRLNALFAAGEIEKTYWAVVLGSPKADSGVVDLALQKLNRKDGWKMVADPSGQSAVTRWRLLGRGNGMSWLECKPQTGRTHQVRVHCAALGCPILGDPVYAAATNEPRSIEAPLQLHARAVSIPYVEGAPPIGATAPVPLHMRKALAACGWRDDR